MPMASRDIVKNSLGFTAPERIPMGLPDPYPNDIVSAGVTRPDDPLVGAWRQVDGHWTMLDEWGNTWSRLEGFTKGEVTHGALEDDWSRLDSYAWPDLGNPARYHHARQVFAGSADRYRIGGLPGFPFAIARYMRRMENFLADVLIEPDRSAELLQRVADLLEESIAQFAAAGADGVMFAEDWGTQDRLLVSPRTWRSLFRPGFEQLCDAARRHGVDVWMHSCGAVYEIIPDLVDVGIAVLQFDQPELHGVDNLARDFGGRVNFWCPVDIQRSLQTRDRDTIEAAAQQMIGKLGCYGGGFIAGYYGSNEAIGLEPWVQGVACRAFVKYSSTFGCPSEA